MKNKILYKIWAWAYVIAYWPFLYKTVKAFREDVPTTAGEGKNG